MTRTRIGARTGPRPDRRRLSTAALSTGLLALVLLTGGCGAGQSSGSEATSDATSDAAAPGAAPAEDAPAEDGSTASGSEAVGADAGSGTGGARAVAGAPPAPGAPVAAIQRAIISTGTVDLETDDVAATLADVQRVTDRVGGQVTERSAETDDRGGGGGGGGGGGADDPGLVRARVVLRVPAERFGQVMADLEATAGLLGSDTTSQDVTTQLVDTDARVEVARRSIDRVAVLLDRAESISDVVAVEAQLARREADLASLLQQQTYLGDQSSLSTITVSLERSRSASRPEPREQADAGFLAGLSTGWDALSGATVVALTVLGAVLPWLVLALLAGLPGAALARSLRRRTATGSGGAGAPAGSAGPTT